MNGWNWCRILQFLIAVVNAVMWYICGHKSDDYKREQ
jgi:hypothetical protein